VASRGLDVERITLVINYDIPSTVRPYVHRDRFARPVPDAAVTPSVPGHQGRRFLSGLRAHGGQPIDLMKVPTKCDIKPKRLEGWSAAHSLVKTPRAAELELALLSEILQRVGRRDRSHAR